MKSDSAKIATSVPPVVTTVTSDSTSKRMGGGLTLEFAVRDKITLGVDVLYRRAGFNRNSVRVAGIDDEDTDDDERTTTQDIETTKAGYWDVPVIARFYNRSRSDEGKRAFVLAGMAFRHASAIQTVREVVRADGLSDTYDTPSRPARSNVGGIVIGAGYQLMDDVRFKFTPEIRLTRWLSRTFDNSPTHSEKNQIEFVFGVTF